MNQNPFLETFTIPYIRLIKRDVPGYKELESNDYVEIEQERYTRVYRERGQFEYLIANLSFTGLKMYTWLVYNLAIGADSIALDDVELTRVLGCSDRHVARMRKEMIQFAILAKKKENQYWVNPRFFATESRLKIYPQCKQLVTSVYDAKKAQPTQFESVKS